MTMTMTSILPDPIRQAISPLIRRSAEAYVLLLEVDGQHDLARQQDELLDLLSDTEKNLRNLVSLILRRDIDDRVLFRIFQEYCTSILQGCTFTIELLHRQLLLYNSSRYRGSIAWNDSLDLLKKYKRCLQALTDVLKSGHYLTEYHQLLGGIADDESTAKELLKHFCEEHGLSHGVLQSAEHEGADGVSKEPSDPKPPDSLHSRCEGYQAGLSEGKEIGRQDVFDILKKMGILTEGEPENRSVWLFRAIEKKSVEGVKMIIDLGADVNQLCVGKNLDKKDLPLCRAARLGYDEIVEVLLNEKADIHGRSEFGNTALLSAAAAGKVSTMRILLAHGANIEEKSTAASETGYTPLMRAVSAGRKDAIKFLQERGADESVKNKARETLLHIAIKKGNLDIISEVTKMRLQFESDKNDDIALHIACKKSKPEVVELLIKESETQLRIPNKKKETPLHVAIKEKRLEIVEILLKKNPPLDLEAEGRKTPLHYAIKAAVESKSVEVVKMLCKKQPPLRSRDEDGKTPLHHAVLHNNLELVNILLKKVPPLDSEDNSHNTLLHDAVKSQTPEIVDALLKKNPPLEAKDQKGKTPLEHALQLPNLRIIEALLKKGSSRALADGKAKMLLHHAVESRNNQLISLLLKYHAPVEKKDEHGKTPLHHAVASRNIKIIELLLEHKSSLTAEDESGKTPLHHAVELQYPDVVKLLLEKNPPLESKDKSGKTPLHYAVESLRSDVVHTLLSSGAKGDIADAAGTTPLEYVLRISASNEQASIQLLQEFFRWHEEGAFFTATFPALSKASRDGNLALVREICRHDKQLINKVPKKTTRFQPALHEAVKHGRLEVVRTLCDYRITNKNLFDQSGNTPLHQAVLSGHRQMVSLLIEKGADEDLQNKHTSLTPLHVAARTQSIELVRKLLDAGANPRLRVHGHGEPCVECKNLPRRVQGMNARCFLRNIPVNERNRKVFDRLDGVLFSAIKKRAGIR